jgi:ATP-dependent DNA helicase RecQ
LFISPKGAEFLREKPPLSLRILKKEKRGRAAARREARGALPAADQALFEKLRARRMELAKAQGVPPYVIFHDKTLMEMAARSPRSIAELRAIAGIGDAKLARYGAAFLAVINGGDGD